MFSVGKGGVSGRDVVSELARFLVNNDADKVRILPWFHN